MYNRLEWLGTQTVFDMKVKELRAQVRTLEAQLAYQQRVQYTEMGMTRFVLSTGPEYALSIDGAVYAISRELGTRLTSVFFKSCNIRVAGIDSVFDPELDVRNVVGMRAWKR